jgi:uncharacterized protein
MPGPKPIPDPDSQPYWDALREHRLLFQRCRACGHAQLYFRAVCRRCWSRDLQATEAAGTGTVHSFSVMHAVGDPELKAELPYAIAIIELDEGARLLSRIDGDPASAHIGQRVRVTYRDLDEETTIPHFEAAA